MPSPWHSAVTSAALASLGAAAGTTTQQPQRPWQAWLTRFGHDDYTYPEWISEQMGRCRCELVQAEVRCFEDERPVDWQTAEDFTWCSARHFLLASMPEFDLHFLPGAVSVDGTSMLDDNIAFSLMAWQASSLDPRPPLRVAFSSLLPYATYHEARVNWRPLFFAKYFNSADGVASSRGVVDALIGGGARLMNWTAYTWPGFAGRASKNTYELGPFASGSSPPVVSPFELLAYGYGSCTGWAKFLASALKALGVPAREAGAPCWNTGEFAGLAVDNPKVSTCWSGGSPGGPGGKFLNNHNWVEYWDNVANEWHFVDIATSSSSEATWFCGTFTGGCACSSNAGKSSQDHDILAPTWSPAGDHPELNGGPVLNVADLRLSTGEPVSPMVWSPRLLSPLGIPLKDVGLRVVNRTGFYRCKPSSAAVLPNLVSIVS